MPLRLGQESQSVPLQAYYTIGKWRIGLNAESRAKSMFSPDQITTKPLARLRRRNAPAHTRAIIRRIAGLGRRSVLGAEVGVYRGENAAKLLSWLPGLRLWVVDAYLPMPPVVKGAAYGADYDMGRLTQADLDAAFAEACELTAFAKHRVTWCFCDSAVAANVAPRRAFCFAFIDAQHVYEAVMRDLLAWWPNVRPGGYLCGHDYNTKMDRHGWGVTRAVDEFAKAHSLEVEVDGGHTWWIRKPLSYYHAEFD